MVSARALLALAFLGVLAPPPAQAAEESLQVPIGALQLLDVPVDVGRPFAMLRAVRVLYGLPRRDRIPPPIADFHQLLVSFDRIDAGLARTRTRTINLTMASGSAERDALRDILDALTLRLREQRGVYTVEPQSDRSAAERRALLLRAGVDTEDISRRLNLHETVSLAPPVVDLPLPLPFDAWAGHVLDRPVRPETLFNAIVQSREASLLYYGVQAMTADTRTYMAKTPELLRWLRERAGVVAGFGGAFRVGADGRVLVPGGAEAAELWEGLMDEKVTQPDRFARALFARDGGRAAYFADALWALDDPHTRFALGLWIADRQKRQERFRALYAVFAEMDSAWSAADVPFARPSHDAAQLLSLLRLNDEGLLTAPSYRRLWERAVDGMELPGVDDRQMQEPAADGIADAAALAGFLAGRLARERALIIERVAFGQRTFAGVADADLQHVLVALRGFGRFPTAMLALERIGVRQPSLFAQTARRAATLEALDPSAAVPVLTQFQGTLALLERLARTGAVERTLREQLVASLVAIELEDSRYRGAVAEWLRAQLIPALPQAGSGGTEARLLDALADRIANPGASFSWEGQDFVIDGERLRRDVRAARAKQDANSLDTLLELYAHASALGGNGLTLTDVTSRAARLAKDAVALSSARPWTDASDAVPAVKRVVDRTVRDLGAIRAQKDVNRAARIVRPLVDVLDYLLGETLVAFVYAASLGESGGRGLASSTDVSHRHVFGFATVAANPRLMPWRRPTRGSTAGDAVTGSLMGIDLALARTRLRRLTVEGLPETPKLNGNDRDTMAETVALLNPREQEDAQHAETARVIGQGRSRVEQWRGDAVALDGLAAALRMAPSRRALIPWTVAHSSASLLELFSQGELFRLGGGQPAAIDASGTSHEPVSGCFCARFPDDSSWELASGRPDTGQSAARTAELNLRVATLLVELRIPATLFPYVMAFATQDYVDSVPLLYEGDWTALARRASTISRERMEDYVAAVVASGPARLVEESGR